MEQQVIGNTIDPTATIDRQGPWDQIIRNHFKSLKINETTFVRIFWNLGLIALGSFFYAVAINGILIPRQFLCGGFMGLLQIVQPYIPWLSMGALYALVNVPVYIIGWRYVGKRFFIFSLAGLVVFSAALQWTHVQINVQDPLASALLAGIICGAGAGIILRSWGCAGGLDILSIVLVKRFSISVGTTLLAFNAIVIAVGAFVFSLEKALYTLIFLFVSSHIIDLVVTGFTQRKAALIISPLWEDVRRGIIDDIHRGVTIINAEGGYSGQGERVLLTVVSFRELSRLKRLINRIDPGAFVVVYDTLEVMGRRIGNQPHW